MPQFRCNQFGFAKFFTFNLHTILKRNDSILKILNKNLSVEKWSAVEFVKPQPDTSILSQITTIGVIWQFLLCKIIFAYIPDFSKR